MKHKRPIIDPNPAKPIRVTGRVSEDTELLKRLCEQWRRFRELGAQAITFESQSVLNTFEQWLASTPEGEQCLQTMAAVFHDAANQAMAATTTGGFNMTVKDGKISGLSGDARPVLAATLMVYANLMLLGFEIATTPRATKAN